MMLLQTNDLLITLYDLFMDSKLDISDLTDKERDCITKFVLQLCERYNIKYDVNNNILDYISQQTCFMLNNCYAIADNIDIITDYSDFEIALFVYDVYKKSHIKPDKLSHNAHRICNAFNLYENTLTINDK